MIGLFKNLTFFLLFLVAAAQAQSTDWKYEKNVEGIKVYSRKAGKVKEIRIETTFDASLSNVAEAVLDVPNFPNWIYKVTSSKVIKNIPGGKVQCRNVIDMPWPVDDRDVVVITSVKQDPVTKIVTMEDNNTPDDIPQVKGLIRVLDFYARWVFEPQGNQVKGTYFFHSDPGGEVPEYVVNLFVAEGPVASVSALKKQISKYRGKSSHGILD